MPRRGRRPGLSVRRERDRPAHAPPPAASRSGDSCRRRKACTSGDLALLDQERVVPVRRLEPRELLRRQPLGDALDARGRHSRSLFSDDDERRVCRARAARSTAAAPGPTSCESIAAKAARRCGGRGRGEAIVVRRKVLHGEVAVLARGARRPSRTNPGAGTRSSRSPAPPREPGAVAELRRRAAPRRIAPLGKVAPPRSPRRRCAGANDDRRALDARIEQRPLSAPYAAERAPDHEPHRVTPSASSSRSLRAPCRAPVTRGKRAHGKPSLASDVGLVVP